MTSYTTTVIICDYCSKGWLGSGEGTFMTNRDSGRARGRVRTIF